MPSIDPTGPIFPTVKRRPSGRVANPKLVSLSTFPFSDGFPWDDPLIRAGRRAVSTHGATWRDHGWRLEG